MASPHLKLLSKEAEDAYQFKSPLTGQNSIYSLQAATDFRAFGLRSHPPPEYDGTYMFESTCIQGGDELRCFDTCDASFSIFSSFPALYNCMLSVALIYWISTNAVPVMIETLDGPKRLAISNDTSAADALLSKFEVCLIGGCRSLNCLNPLATPPSHADRMLALSEYVEGSLCPAVLATVDPDVGGIGVRPFMYSVTQLNRSRYTCRTGRNAASVSQQWRWPSYTDIFFRSQDQCTTGVLNLRSRTMLIASTTNAFLIL